MWIHSTTLCGVILTTRGMIGTGICATIRSIMIGTGVDIILITTITIITTTILCHHHHTVRTIAQAIIQITQLAQVRA